MTLKCLAFKVQTASREDIHGHLQQCNEDYRPALDRRVDLAHYATKIHDNALTFEAWCGGVLVGLVAAYLNDAPGRVGYVTNVSVTRPFRGQGVAKELMAMCLRTAESRGIEAMVLEVSRDNAGALALYRRCGFEECEVGVDEMVMKLRLRRE